MYKSINSKATILAWIIMLFSSILPVIILQEIFNNNTEWVLSVQLFLLIILLLLSFKINYLSKIKLFILMMITLLTTDWLIKIINNSKLWNLWFGSEPNFIMWLLKGQLLRLAAALIIFLVLVYIKKNRKNFFVIKGNIDADVKPIKYILNEPTTWKKFGKAFAIYLSVGTLIFLIIAGGIPSLDKLINIIPLLPLITLFAAINSFYEELGYRAAFIGVLEDKIGSKNSLYLTSVLFGIGHFYGVPYGIVGVMMAAFLGYILGKSMIETRGFFWAFFIHMLQDIIIFSFIAFNMITPGG